MPNGKSSQRLDSWKDIAAYLGRDVRTVIRWEKEKGLPVHRVPGGRRQSVFAYPDELNTWLDSGTSAHDLDAAQTSEADPAPEGHDRSPKPRPFLTRKFLFGTLAILLLAVAAGAGLLLTDRSASGIAVQGITQLTDDAAEKRELITDGSTVYFSERRDGRYVIAAVPVTGGTIRTLTAPDVNTFPVDISADGKELLVLTFRGFEELKKLWILPLDGRPPRRVGNVLCQSAAWSPDDKAIAYSVGNEIDLTTNEGATSTRLLVRDLNPSRLRWSHDGRYLRFIISDPKTNRYNAFEVAMSGYHAASGPTRIGTETTDWPAWTESDRRGNYLVLPRSHGIAEAVSMLKDGDTSDAKPVKGIQDLGAYGAIALDRTGSRVFLLAARQQLTELFQVETHSQSFIPFLPKLGGIFLDYSRDGRWLTYVSIKDSSLWASRPDGSDAIRLDFDSVRVELPRFSPDGSEVAYMSKRADRPWRIMIVPREGGVPREAAVGNDSQGAPTWSPDGKSIVYGGIECQPTNSCAIHLINVATRTVLTIPGSAGLGTARWSPDGRYIAALNASQYQVLLYDIATNHWRKIADGINGNDLCWSHDSRYVYAKRSTDEDSEIVRIKISNGELKSVVDLSGLNKLPGSVDTWFCLTPQDTPIVLRSTTGSEVYSARLISK